MIRLKNEKALRAAVIFYNVTHWLSHNKAESPRKSMSLRWLEMLWQHQQKQNPSTVKAARLGDLLWGIYALIQKGLVFNCKKSKPESFQTQEPRQYSWSLNNLVASYHFSLIPLLLFNLQVRNRKAPDDSNLCHHCGPCAVRSQVRTAEGKAGGARGKF